MCKSIKIVRNSDRSDAKRHFAVGSSAAGNHGVLQRGHAGKCVFNTQSKANGDRKRGIYIRIQFFPPANNMLCCVISNCRHVLCAHRKNPRRDLGCSRAPRRWKNRHYSRRYVSKLNSWNIGTGASETGRKCTCTRFLYFFYSIRYVPAITCW